MAEYQISTVADAIPGTKRILPHPEVMIRWLLTDSRKLADPATSIFFAIRTSANDGHRYILSLYRQGLRNFIVAASFPDAGLYPEANFIFVEDTVRALQELGRFHRNQMGPQVIGITGSNGKTVVKEWLYDLMRADKRIYRSPKSYNSQVGVPLSLWLMETGDEIAIIEAGISKPGEMEYLRRMIRPEIGIITNLGHAHQENFSTLAEKATEKLLLFRDAATLIYCSDNGILNRALDASGIQARRISWSRYGEGDITVTHTETSGGRTTIFSQFPGMRLEFSIPFTDEASVENAMHCAVVMWHLGYDREVIRTRMGSLHPIAMRMELKDGLNQCTLINDAYSSDLESLNIALDFLVKQHQHPKRTVIISDLLESGMEPAQLYTEVNHLLESRGIEKVIGIGPSISYNAGSFSMEKHFYPDTRDFLEKYPFSEFRNESILIKGARAFGFEDISKALQQKMHETELEINLSALVHNLNYFRSWLKPGTKVMAMVKAFSYGSGSHEIANLLQYHNVDYLAVAYTDEGIELRKSGIRIPIMVMSPDQDNYDQLFHHSLEAEIYSRRSMENLASFIENTVKPGQKPFPIHLKIDTGMHRLGFVPEDTGWIVQILRENPLIEVISIFSHLAASDDAEEDEFTRRQIDDFRVMADEIIRETGQPAMRHILNSAGMMRFPDAHFDMVRLGIGLYGFSSIPQAQENLLNVSTFKTRVTQIKHIPAGGSVGYNRRYQADNNTRIAIVPVGYADGLNRQLGNGRGFMMIRGKRYPIIGSICMDMAMINIGNATVEEGDEVIIFGDDLPASEIASLLGTIPYEILTGISRRVKRVYFHD